MTELLRIFAANLLPIFLIAGAGYLLGRNAAIDVRSFGRIVFYVLSPALIFDLLIRNDLPLIAVSRTVLLAVSLVVIIGLIAWWAGLRMGMERPALAALVLTTMFANTGNYGLPLLTFAFGQEALALGSVYFITMAILFNTVGVFVASLGRLSFKQAALGLLKVPPVYAVLLALLVARLDVSLPGAARRAVRLLSDAAIPSMLILLGLELQRVRWTANWRPLALSSALRLLVGPLVGLGVSALLGMEGAARQAGVISAAMPTAVATTVLATEYEVLPEYVTAAVFLSTVLSPFTLVPLVFFLGR